MHKAIRACIFDLDGTLIDSLDDLADAANAALLEADFPAHPVDAYRDFVGNGIETLIRRALPADVLQRIDPLRVQAIVQHMSHIYARRWNAKTRCYEGIAELVDQLREKGLPLAVLSNKPHVFTCEIVEHFFPSKPFDLVYGARAHVPNKPDPCGALQVATELGLDPAHVLFVGDSNVDMHTGRKAGMPAVGVCWGFRSREELLEAGATALVEQPADLAALLTQQ